MRDRTTMDAIEKRLDAWGSADLPAGDRVGQFLNEVGRARAQRQTRAICASGVLAAALATATMWALLPVGGGGGLQSSGVERGVIAGLATDAELAPLTGDGAAWTLGALTRRASSSGDGDLLGEDLLPGGWSMGWAAGSPL